MLGVVFQDFGGGEGFNHLFDGKACFTEGIDNGGKGAVVNFYAVHKPSDLPFALYSVVGQVDIELLAVFVFCPTATS